MSIVSYAQNFEDVMLWRVLGDVPQGCYIDVGAQHPVVDSVSKAFYENGWRGIHVEPTTTHANLLRADRPDEIVLEAVVAESAGVLPFYEIPDTGLSTARKDIAEEHQTKHGWDVRATAVTAITLDDLLELAQSEEIHWLKIDVEGFEKEVLSGWRKSPRRPWVVVVEATYPLSTVDTFEDWESLILEKGYALVYQDGLNRFYLRHDQERLQPRFHFPPNVFDGIQFSGTATSLTTELKSRFDQQLASANNQTAALQGQLVSTEAALQGERGEARCRELALEALCNQVQAAARERTEAHLIERLQQEREYSEQLRQLQVNANAREATLQAELSAVLQDARRAVEAQQSLQISVAERSEALLNQLLRQQREHSEQLLKQQAEAHTRETALQAELAAGLLAAQREAEAMREYARREDQLKAGQQLVLEALREELSMSWARLEAALADARMREQALSDLVRRTTDDIRRRDEVQRLERQEQAQAHLEQIITQQSNAEARERAQRQEAAEALAVAQQRSDAHIAALVDYERVLVAHLLTSERDARRRESELQSAHQTGIAELQREWQDRHNALAQEAHARETAWTAEQQRMHHELVDQVQVIRKLSDDVNALQQSWTWRLMRFFLARPLFEHPGDVRALIEKSALLQSPARNSQERPQHLLTEYPDLTMEIAPSVVAAAIVTAPRPPQGIPRTDAMSLDELLGLSSQLFLNASYIAILGREADSDGLNHYRERLRRGFGKFSVLVDLMQSREAEERIEREGAALKSTELWQDLLWLSAEEKRLRSVWRWWMTGRRLEHRLRLLEISVGSAIQKLNYLMETNSKSTSMSLDQPPIVQATTEMGLLAQGPEMSASARRIHRRLLASSQVLVSIRSY